MSTNEDNQPTDSTQPEPRKLKGDFNLVQFCTARLEAAERDIEGIYTRASLVIGLLTLIGGATFSLATPEAIALCFVRLDCGIYYLSLATSFVFIAKGGFHTAQGMKARSYRDLPMLESLCEAICADCRDRSTGLKGLKIIDDAVADHVLYKVQRVETSMRKVSESRRIELSKATNALLVAAAACGLAALCLFILRAQGIVTHV